MTFFGLGYHEHRLRWITGEWFWYKTYLDPDPKQEPIDKVEAQEIIHRRRGKISPYLQESEQTENGKLFELLADLTDEDGAMAEMEDLESLNKWIFDIDLLTPPEQPPDALLEEIPVQPPPTGENLLDQASQEELPPLYSGEEKGLDALGQVKFFAPDSNWSWYASEFDGDDIFFGLVDGFELELGYFSLKELREARGPLGLPIERDLNFQLKTLRELMEKH